MSAQRLAVLISSYLKQVFSTRMFCLRHLRKMVLMYLDNSQ